MVSISQKTNEYANYYTTTCHMPFHGPLCVRTSIGIYLYIYMLTVLEPAGICVSGCVCCEWVCSLFFYLYSRTVRRHEWAIRHAKSTFFFFFFLRRESDKNLPFCGRIYAWYFSTRFAWSISNVFQKQFICIIYKIRKKSHDIYTAS